MMKKGLLFTLLFIFIGTWAAFAQTKVSGTVSDDKGEALVGASVVVKGTTNGTLTDEKGTFSLAVDKNAILTISFVGYDAEDVSLNGQSKINVILRGGENLGEVVVVGYGTQKKANLTGAVTSISQEELLKRQVASTSTLLQGLAPGATITQQSGRPGADGGSINIRGIGSISANTYPLVLVDNVPVGDFDNIDPNNIESVSILKDAAAAAIFGSKAANGVILITTKRGKAKGVQIQYSTFVTAQSATNLPTKVSGLEHMEMRNLARKNEGAQAAFSQSTIDEYKTGIIDNFKYINTDWIKEVLANDGLMQNHNLNLSMGTDRAKVFAAGTYLNQQGLTLNTSYKKYDFRINTDLKINDKLTLQTDVNYYNTTVIAPAGNTAEQIIRRTLGMPAIGAGRFNDGTYGDAGQSNKLNPIALAEASGTRNDGIKNLLFRGNLVYQPFSFMKMEGMFTNTTRASGVKTYRPTYQIYRPDLVTGTLILDANLPTPNGLSQSITNLRVNNYLAQSTFSKTFGQHDVKLMVGFQAEDLSTETLSASGTDLPVDQPYLNVTTANKSGAGGANESATAGVFGRLNYVFNNRYLFEVNGRYDGSSRFSQSADKQWGFFPSVSAGWILSEEGFLKQNKLITFAKIRGSWGTLGNQNIVLSSDPSTSSNDASAANYPFTTNISGGANYYFNNRFYSGVAQTTAGNPSITWETSEQRNLGIDFTLFKNIDVTFDAYQRDIRDMILQRPIPGFVGFSAPFVNAGSMTNKGWELSIGYKGKAGDFKYGVTASMSDVQNKVTDLGGQEFFSGNQIARVGYPLYSYFGYQAGGLFQDTTEYKTSVQYPKPFTSTSAGDIRYLNTSGAIAGSPLDTAITASDRVVLGNKFPRYEYALNVNLSWKGFDFNVFIQGVGMRQNYISGTGAHPFVSPDFTGTAYTWHRDNWRPDNVGATYPRLTETLGNNQVSSSYWMRDGSYFRLKNLQIGYSLPESLSKRMKIGGLRVYFSGQNLFTKSNFVEGFDPERNNNNAEFYPIMKTYTVGLTLKL
jgi:TonB-linked SusC/RagA family outer membrane protein